MLESKVYDYSTGSILQVIQYQGIEFYFGLIIGALIGLTFWGVAKGMQ